MCVSHTSRGTYPRHILHEDGQSLLSAVPQTAIVLHNALVLQVFQQLDLTLQSTHLLGERPVVTSALRTRVCLPGISSACSSQCPQRGLSAFGTSAGETGDSLNCLAVGLNAANPWNAGIPTQAIGKQWGGKSCGCLVTADVFIHSDWSVGHTQS